jgi:hypothetical protein
MNEFISSLINVLRFRKIYIVKSSANVNPAGNAVVTTTDERQVQLDRPKQRVNHVQPLGGTVPKPTVIGQIQEKIRLSILTLANFVRE